ncbi:phosphoribosyltransferase [Hyperthermus butylicus]|uniref:Phosphoribosyltransferase n=1 Tax=Hyperthermus butylicus (strain DSM 5456 / JCM 9403 / PLM1-5) TaxID=415426 RepID=A2BK42_HYPBU|nr:phosphoribosyltransferase family protein [Hyperthermus butylicus]ABM80353.1 phosphoribosyltransferase [Hyperthermus butylicus DSM 5456]
MAGETCTPRAYEPSGDRVVYCSELSWKQPVFRDRIHAGEVLAEFIHAIGVRTDYVFGLAAGGVPVAATTACKLGVAFDAIVVKKITFPWTSEAGFGAVALDGTLLYDEDVAGRLGYSKEDVKIIARKLSNYIEERTRRIRGSTNYPSLNGMTVLLVDDGIATGYTMAVGVQFLRKLGASRVIAAAPTGSIDGSLMVSKYTELVAVANLRSGPYFAVADAYLEWHDVSDDEAQYYYRVGLECQRQGSS